MRRVSVGEAAQAEKEAIKTINKPAAISLPYLVMIGSLHNHDMQDGRTALYKTFHPSLTTIATLEAAKDNESEDENDGKQRSRNRKRRW